MQILSQLFNRIKIVVAMIQFVGDITKTDKIIEIGKKIADREKLKLVHTKLKSIPENQFVFATRYQGPNWKIEDLEKMQPGTLGFEYARFLKTHGLSPIFYDDSFDKNDDIEFMQLRARQLHDFWHLLLGYDISPKSELAVQASTIAQTGGPFSGIIFALVLLHITIKTPFALQESMEEAFRAWQVSVKAKSFFSLKFEERWTEQLSSVRNSLGLPQ